MLPLIAVLGCAPPLTATGDKATPTPDARVVAFNGILSTQTLRRPGSQAIVDSEALYSVLHLDATAVAELVVRLPELTSVGSANPIGDCTQHGNAQPPCTGISVRSFSERRGILTMEVLWYPIGVCGSTYAATYDVRVKGYSVEKLDLVEREWSHCAPRDR